MRPVPCGRHSVVHNTICIGLECNATQSQKKKEAPCSAGLICHSSAPVNLPNAASRLETKSEKLLVHLRCKNFNCFKFIYWTSQSGNVHNPASPLAAV